MNSVNKPDLKSPRILILGAGFGGLYSYLKLIKKRDSLGLDITIVNSSDYFIFTPIISEYLSGSIDIDDVRQKLSRIIKPNLARLIIADVLSIDLKKQIVKTSKAELGYDYLIIALGSKTNFYGIDGAEQNSHVFKSLDDVDSIKESIKLKSRDIKAPDRLKIAVIGGGPKGSELAVKINEIGTKQAKIPGSPKKSDNFIDVYLVDAGKQILKSLPLALRKRATVTLQNQGISVRTGLAINKVTASSIQFSNGESLKADIIIWAAGVTPALPDIALAELDPLTNQIIVDEKLSLIGYDNAFAIGDIAAVKVDNKKVPTLAQIAVQESKVAAGNIIRSISNTKLKDYKYTPIGIVIPLGRWKGVGQIFGFNISGGIVWLSCKVVYVLRFPIRRKRFTIVYHWIHGLFT